MKGRYLASAEVILIILMACIPLFASFPYRVNIFLSWEGAYRISEGQLPFRDFGTPLGGMFWVVPAIFFKIFGPYLITLVKAQVFINIVAAFAFRSIFKSLSLSAPIRLVIVFLFCLSFSFSNFWPWYNHSVIVYELVALAFLFRYLTASVAKKQTFLWLAAAALFVCFSLFTKQDGGGLAFIICFFLLALHGFQEKKWLPLAVFVISFTVLLLLIILPFSGFGFGYWFNHGQPPHTARVSIKEIIAEFFYGSQWIKFYLFLIALLLLAYFKTWKQFWEDKNTVLFVSLTLAILVEAAIFQVTSYTPPDNNIFFHSFAIGLILHLISRLSVNNFEKPFILFSCLAGIIIWWSTGYWKYCERIIDRILPQSGTSSASTSATGENLINKNTYMISNDEPEIPMNEWVYSRFASFKNIYMPKPTVDGMERLMNLEMVKRQKIKQDIKVLNMSELTPLAVEIPYALEKNQELPLWYHLGVGMFNRQAELYEKRVAAHYYDLVLFEYIPGLNNFYPFRVRDSLQKHYTIIDKFPAPRRGDTQGNIEVYIKSAR